LIVLLTSSGVFFLTFSSSYKVHVRFYLQTEADDMRTEFDDHLDADAQSKIIKKRDTGETADAKSSEPSVDQRASGNAVASMPLSQVPSLPGIVIIDRRSLTRECLARALRTITDTPIISLPTVEAWIEVADKVSASAILLCVSGKPRDPECVRQLALLEQASDRIPLVVLGDSEDPEHIIEFLDHGARGYIPTSMSLPITLQTVRLVAEGGVFVPASSLMASHRQLARSGQAGKDEQEMFTSRQAAVVEAVCRGKPNKVIAYELNMCESTVKVHVRNIMKKLNAKNRTEVAVIVKGHNGDQLFKPIDHRHKTT
jgi:DNA-binding NarL/FixJ family response regulator